MQNSYIRNNCWKIFIQFCQHNFVNWRKHIYSGHTENPKEPPMYASAATKKKDVTTKRLRTRSTFRQSLMTSVSESQVVDIRWKFKAFECFLVLFMWTFYLANLGSIHYKHWMIKSSYTEPYHVWMTFYEADPTAHQDENVIISNPLARNVPSIL